MIPGRTHSRVPSIASHACSALIVATMAIAARADDCLEEAAGSVLSCNAGDVSILSIEVTDVRDPCEFSGDTATLDAVLHVRASTANLYDLGFFLGTDALSSTDSDCGVASLAPEASSLDGDACGDVAGAGDFLVPVTGVTMLCVDRDDDGFFDLGTCATWRDASDNTDCPDAGRALPGNLSQCHCQTIQPASELALCETNVDCAYEQNVCTDNVCDPSSPDADELGCTFPPNTRFCDDGAACTANDTCSGGTCAGVPRSCDDGVPCTADTCNEATGACEHSACNDDSGDLVCLPETWWASRSGFERGENAKKRATANLAQSLLDSTGPLEICGQTLDATSNAHAPYLEGLGLRSVLEALCVQGNASEQQRLYRLLVTTALDCAASGHASDCEDVVERLVGVSLTACSQACAGIAGESAARGRCIERLELLGRGSCRSADLCHDASGFCPRGSAPSSIAACNEARRNACSIDACP